MQKMCPICLWLAGVWLFWIVWKQPSHRAVESGICMCLTLWSITAELRMSCVLQSSRSHIMLHAAVRPHRPSLDALWQHNNTSFMSQDQRRCVALPNRSIWVMSYICPIIQLQDFLMDDMTTRKIMVSVCIVDIRHVDTGSSTNARSKLPVCRLCRKLEDQKTRQQRRPKTRR